MKVNVNYLVSGALLVLLFNCNYVYAAHGLQTTTQNNNKRHHKRQIYREQVLPHAGGKIPDSAFDTDRLTLNRLQKEGIAVPDGILLEQRNPQVFQYPNKSQRPVYQVTQTSDQRYTPVEGRFSMVNGPPTVETTYSLPQIVHHDVVVPRDPMVPVERHFSLPNALLKGGLLKTGGKHAPPLDCHLHQPKGHQHFYMNKHAPLPPVALQSLYPTYDRIPAKFFSHFPHAQPIYMPKTALKYGTPLAAPLHWNYSLMGPDHSANLIFGDFQTFFNSLQHGIYQPGHMGPIYYHHNSY